MPTRGLGLFCLVIGLASAVLAQHGAIIGTVRHNDTREPIPAVNVRIVGTGYGAATDERGQFRIGPIPSGTYTLLATAVGHRSSEGTVHVTDGEEVRKDLLLVDEAVRAGDVMVYGASMRRERVTDAPAAVSQLTAADIARRAGSGQLPKLLENEPGIDIVQSGLFDFNINTRGFNSSLNRRVLVLLDGRDLGTAFLGATEWNGLSIPLEEMGRLEMVRGPGSALYGANAFNGVMNITSLTPRTSQGTKVIVGGGDPLMYRADVRHAGASGAWSYRVNAGTIRGESFSRNRSWGPDSLPRMKPTTDFEYQGFTPGLNNEVVILSDDLVASTYGAARVDYDFESGSSATLEGGTSLVQNETIVTGIGRVQAVKATRPWVRAHFQDGGFVVNAWANGRYNSEADRSLSTGLPLIQDALISHAEVQYAFRPIHDLFVVVGASHRIVDIDTKGTLMASARTDNMSGLFGQVEYTWGTLKALAAARWDRSSLYESQLSPKAALVWSVSSDHSLRFTFNRAFQSPNYSELYLNVKHPLRAVVYFGNPKLKPETITGYELGYKGILNSSVFVTAEAYFNVLNEFVTDLGPGVNPDYLGPVILPGESSSRQVWSYTNAGEVQEAGIDVGVNVYVNDSWKFDANASYFTFEVVSRHPNDVLLPNAPKYKLNAGVTYLAAAGWEASGSLKHVPGYPWAAGIYRGDIASYTLLNLAASYPISTNLRLLLNVSNALDSRHYEIFGGSVLGRRAIMTVVASF